jgi:hypothetical protein
MVCLDITLQESRVLEHFEDMSKKVFITQNIDPTLFAAYAVHSVQESRLQHRHVVPLLPLFPADTGKRFA